MPGLGELLVVLLIVLLLFGASRVTGIARALGKSVGEFKKGMKDDDPKDGPQP